MQIDPLTCGYDRTKRRHAFLLVFFVFRFILILSFKNRKIEEKSVQNHNLVLFSKEPFWI